VTKAHTEIFLITEDETRALIRYHAEHLASQASYAETETIVNIYTRIVALELALGKFKDYWRDMSAQDEGFADYAEKQRVMSERAEHGDVSDEVPF
jgi:hypothetical protein